MIRQFNEYLQEGDVENQSPDLNEAKALMSKAERRLSYIKEHQVKEQNADLIFEDAYNVMREASHALMSAAGYKPLSHEVVIAYLRDNEKLDQSVVERFDSYRKLRNRVQYSAQKITVIRTQESIVFATEIFALLRTRLKE